MKKDEICIERNACRICGSPVLTSVINLGQQYLASIFIKDRIPTILQQRYPLELVMCAGENSCGLIQLKHSISSEVLYFDYGYRSGINEQMRANLKNIVEKAEKMADLKVGDIVLDIGCNDGTLLDCYRTVGIDRLGFDPAENVACIAADKGLNVVNDFFSYDAFHRARPGKKAKIVTSIAMFYDLEDPMQFANHVATLLADDGIWIIELSYLPFMIENNSFDTICHEHLEYYTLRQIEWILAKEGLKVYRIEFNEINGGSFRLFIRKPTAGNVPEEDIEMIRRVRTNEKSTEYETEKPYQAFRDAIVKVKDDLTGLLFNLQESGKKVYIYGASTKGNTILQYCGIDHTVIQKAADRNPDKWGRKTLGTKIEIISEEQARSEHPDYFLVLPWHFFEVFKQRERKFLKRGGRFIVPLPEVKIIGKDDL